MSEYSVTTTIRPGTVVVVGDAEFLDLQRQGLIAEVVSEGPDAAAPGRGRDAAAK